MYTISTEQDIVATANTAARRPAARKSARNVGLPAIDAPIENNVREMPAVCNRLLALSHLSGKIVTPITIPIRKKTISENGPRKSNKQILPFLTNQAQAAPAQPARPALFCGVLQNAALFQCLLRFDIRFKRTVGLVYVRLGDDLERRVHRKHRHAHVDDIHIKRRDVFGDRPAAA